MSARFRLPASGRVDRQEARSFAFDGQRYEGLRGDTLASALLAHGVRTVASSVRFGRPRGIFSAGVEEPCALIEAPGEPLIAATTAELYNGLEARSLRGRGRLRLDDTNGECDRVHCHCDVLIVGGGAAGLAAALAAGASGARAVLADEGSEIGGGLLATRQELDGAPAAAWVEAARTRLAAFPEVRVLARTTVLGCHDHNYLVALERRTAHLGPAAPAHMTRERVWHIRARKVVLATGAHERPIAFADNDRPGIMLAGAARAYVNRYAVAPGRRAVVFTTNDSAYEAALDLAHGGVEVAAVLDARPEPPDAWARRCREFDIDVHGGRLITGTRGERQLEGVTVAGLDGGTKGQLACDLLAVSGGWNPVVDLFSHAQGRLRFAEALSAFVAAQAVPDMELAGGVRGLTGVGACLRDGARVGAAAARVTGFDPPAVRVPRSDEFPGTPPAALWVVPHPGEGEPWARHFLDLARDATLADVRRAVGAGMRSVEHIKRYTTIGTGPEQGKTSGVLATAAIAELLETPAAEVGTTTYRPPYTPVSFAALAGRDRGALADPVRITGLHAWHLAHGAVFENVGQWKRPRYYPRDDEDMEAAVLRECRAARKGVALQDASTLGKIDVHGPDAPELLDRLYTNLMSSLSVGAIRYGVMCRADGMVFDDGTASRLADDRYLVTTTTGNAAAVLDWFEEWMQTEWSDLRVHCTSVTDHWATVALVGPRSRSVLARVAPGLAIGATEFPFMTWRDAEVAGLDARVCRISFSGELAYEVNVSAWQATALWEALLDAGEQDGITPYGTEAMHVLRAEKGFAIVGQDTDGSVTPQDLGMGWVISKKKTDFVGKRSFARTDTSRPDRKHLVGLLPADPDQLLREGTQLLAQEPSAVPAPMLGHVTSSYRSAALERTFALALVKGGRERVGQTIYAAVDGVGVPVAVTEPVFYDKENLRRDG